MQVDSTLPLLLADLVHAFPRNSVAPETILVYARELSDLAPAALALAVRSLIRSSEWFPSIRAIREQAAEILLALPTESVALSQIEDRVGWARREEHEREGEEPPEVHPMVREALDHVGGFHAFKTADKPAVIRGQFLSLFREMRASRIRDVQVGALADHPALAVSCNA